jgi:hypothetical protein
LCYDSKKSRSKDLDNSICEEKCTESNQINFN